MKIKSWIISTIFLSAAFSAGAQTPSEILDRMDSNATFRTARAHGTITSTDNFGTRVNNIEMLMEGNTHTLITMLDGEERGQRILRTARELFVYYPDADEVVRITGARLRENAIGDISFEDLTNTRSTAERFNAVVTGESNIDGLAVWQLELTARGRGESFPHQTLWVTKDSYVMIRAEFRSSANRLLRSLSASNIQNFGGHFIAAQSEFVDATRRNSRSVMRVNNIEVNVTFPANTFSVSNLAF
jgi:outer membrane lipoprotein-sorting protein